MTLYSDPRISVNVVTVREDGWTSRVSKAEMKSLANVPLATANHGAHHSCLPLVTWNHVKNDILGFGYLSVVEVLDQSNASRDHRSPADILAQGHSQWLLATMAVGNGLPVKAGSGPTLMHMI